VTIALSSLMPQLQRAQALLQGGQGAQAWLVMAPLRAAIDGNGQALRLFALVAQSAGRIDEAIGALKRIAALEGNPPEIVGALADMLGKAGRHRDALAEWDRLVALHPDLPDAHLNRAVTAANAGLQDVAIEAADVGLARFPGHARLLATRAMALKNVGRIEESIGAFAVAVSADPNRALTRHNQGVALRSAFRLEEAREAYAAAAGLGMKGAQFLANWAAATLEAGHVDEAAELYSKALREDPLHDESRRALTRLAIEYRDGEGAFSHYEKVARERPGELSSWVDWAMALIMNRRTAEAEAVAEQGLAAHRDAWELKAVRSYARGLVGDAALALKELDDLSARHPNGSGLLTAIPPIALRAGCPERAAELLERQVADNPGDQVAWSLLSLAWRLIGDPRENWLCDYDRLVMVTTVPSADGKLDSVAYAREVAALLDPLHVTSAEPGDQSLRGGTQTSGPLFARLDPAIQEFRVAVRLAAEKAIAQLADDPTHPFLKRKSLRLGFSGSWSVRLRPGGHHVSHVHPDGWMSSAYYARLPEGNASPRQSHEGWIQFGVPPGHLDLDLPPRRVVEPSPGTLVLFPSYMWHGTIPFASGDRLTAAFDYQPM
jgi:tetratricopeptide (TPR) repeat protein